MLMHEHIHCVDVHMIQERLNTLLLLVIVLLATILFACLIIFTILFTVLLTLVESQRNELITKLGVVGCLGRAKVSNSRGSDIVQDTVDSGVSRVGCGQGGGGRSRSVRDRLAGPVRTDDVWKLAALDAANPLLGEVGTFTYMTVLAVKPTSTIAKHSKVTADSSPGTNPDVGERTLLAGASTPVIEVHAEWCPFRCRIMGELTGVGSLRTVALQKFPANGDLGGVVLIGAGKTTVARPCNAKRVEVIPSEKVITEPNEGCGPVVVNRGQGLSVYFTRFCADLPALLTSP
jgi:hypothetical protein